MRRLACGAVCVLLSAGPGARAGQDPVLPVPANVTVSGVPPVPRSLAEAIAPYARFRQARLVGWHPTERRILVATAFGSVPQLHEVRVPGGARSQLTFFGDGVAPRPGAAFDPSGRFVVFQKDTAGGGEANQLFRYDFSSAAVTLLTDGHSRHGIPVISRTGVVAFDSTARDGKNRDLYVLTPSEPGTARRLGEFDGVWVPLDWTADGRALLALQAASSSDTSLWRLDLASGERTLLTPRGDRPVRWSHAQFAPDGRTVYALGNPAGEHARVWCLAGGALQPVTSAGQVVDAFALSPDGTLLALVVDLGSTTKLQIVDRAGRARRTPALPPGLIADVLWHPSGREVAFSLAGARTFSDVYSVDVAAGRAERWTSSEMGGAGFDALPDAEIVRWPAFDGLQIPGILYRPPAAFRGPRPVIINVHGGPDAREWPRALGRSNYFRQELGVALIYPNIRGSTGFGRSFEMADDGLRREDAVRDIGALLDWIARDPGLDETRVMIAGASYGGYVALASAVAYGNRLRAVNSAFGITDFPSYLESTEVSRQAIRNAEYGDPADPEVRAFLSRISPLAHVARLRVPVYLAAGAKDTRVPIAQSERMKAALEAAGTPVWYVRFEDAGHLQLSAAQSDFSIHAWVLFVQRYLLD